MTLKVNYQVIVIRVRAREKTWPPMHHGMEIYCMAQKDFVNL